MVVSSPDLCPTPHQSFQQHLWALFNILLVQCSNYKRGDVTVNSISSDVMLLLLTFCSASLLPSEMKNKVLVNTVPFARPHP